MINLASVVKFIFSIYMVLIFIRILFVWLRPSMFNPIVRFVYSLTDPYLKLFAGLRFVRIGTLDFSPIVALFMLLIVRDICYLLILQGQIVPRDILLLIVSLFFKFVIFILIVFMIAVALRFIFGFVRFRGNNVAVTMIYSLSEPAVRPFRNLLKSRSEGSFDVAALLSLIVNIILTFLVLPQLQQLIVSLIKGSSL